MHEEHYIRQHEGRFNMHHARRSGQLAQAVMQHAGDIAGAVRAMHYRADRLDLARPVFCSQDFSEAIKQLREHHQDWATKLADYAKASLSDDCHCQITEALTAELHVSKKPDWYHR